MLQLEREIIHQPVMVERGRVFQIEVDIKLVVIGKEKGDKYF